MYMIHIMRIILSCEIIILLENRLRTTPAALSPLGLTIKLYGNLQKK